MKASFFNYVQVVDGLCLFVFIYSSFDLIPTFIQPLRRNLRLAACGLKDMGEEDCKKSMDGDPGFQSPSALRLCGK